MEKVKGLLDITNPYLQEIEKDYPGVGTDFMALLAEGASRVMLGQRVYSKMYNGPKSNSNYSMNTWAAKAAGTATGETISLKKQVLKGTPPRGQNKEDRRIIIRLDSNHEARKSDSFQLRQTIQNLVPDKTLVTDVWKVPSGVAILAPTPAKAATLMQYKKDIENRFGNAVVERQETWTTRTS
ncbi:putative effector protein [Erysiphe necator]|uniref:Putative effector protein n=1 Tax=Uncinula necator TaxID=52586 RepID=A0A0B1NZE9_UNCNE|nr:putative effector protein [Erysiphe necator]